jgi:hypothetical protein
MQLHWPLLLVAVFFANDDIVRYKSYELLSRVGCLVIVGSSCKIRRCCHACQGVVSSMFCLIVMAYSVE